MKQSDNNAQAEEYTGKFYKWIYRNENSSYCIGIYHNKDGYSTLVGNDLPDHPYPVTFQGQWVVNKTFGQQFRVDMILGLLPTEASHIEQFIAEQKVGIGQKRARQMLDLVGLSAFWDTLEKDPLLFCSIKGVKDSAVLALQEKVLSLTLQKELFRFFGSELPLSSQQYKKICKLYDDDLKEALSAIRSNPFVLMSCGYRFDELDRFTAARISLPINDPQRLLAAAQQSLLDAKQKSHVGLPLSELVANMDKLLTPKGRVAKEDLEAFLYGAAGEESLYYSGGLYYLPRAYKEESLVANKLIQMASCKDGNKISRAAFDKEICHYEAKKGFNLSAEQTEAVWTALTCCVCVITGGPGSGKSTILDAILHCWAKFRNESWQLMAPTGKAAVRMTETTQQLATTIHSALGLDVGDEKIDDVNPYVNTLYSSLIVIDEASMIDQTVMAGIMQAVGGKDRDGKMQHLVLVGDPDQLPSVGWGNVLGDIINSGTIPVCQLKTIYRQSSDNPIIANSIRIQSGRTELDWSNRSFRRYHCGTDAENAEKACLFYERCVKQFGIEDVVLLSPFHRKKEISTDTLNAMLQERMNPNGGQREINIKGKRFRIHDRVMQLRNTDLLSNGDVGTVIEVYAHTGDTETCLTVDFGLDASGKPLIQKYTRDELVQLELAYAISVHKAQGSQYKTVIVIMPNQYSAFLRRSIFYTAYTRSKENVAIFSPTDTLTQCILNDKQDDRYTNLAERLQAMLNK